MLYFLAHATKQAVEKEDEALQQLRDELRDKGESLLHDEEVYHLFFSHGEILRHVNAVYCCTGVLPCCAWY